MSPVQNIPQSTAARATPRRIFAGVQLSPRHQCGRNNVESSVNRHAEPVIIHQKSSLGAVSGENMSVHRTAATATAKMTFFIICKRYPIYID